MNEEVPLFDGEVECGDADASSDNNNVHGAVSIEMHDLDITSCSSSVRQSERLSTKVRKRWSRRTSVSTKRKSSDLERKTKSSKKCKVYPVTYKLAAVFCATKTGTKEAADMFQVTISQISMWKSNHDDLMKQLMKYGFGKWEVWLLVWLKTQLYQGKQLGIHQVTEKAKELMASELDSSKFPNFVLSWLKRLGLSLGFQHEKTLCDLQTMNKQAKKPAAIHHGDNSPQLPEINKILTDEQKLQAIEEARNNGTRQAAELFSIPEEYIVSFLSDTKLRVVDEVRTRGTVRASDLYGIPEEQVTQWLKESATVPTVMQESSCANNDPLHSANENVLNTPFRRNGAAMKSEALTETCCELDSEMVSETTRNGVTFISGICQENSSNSRATKTGNVSQRCNEPSALKFSDLENSLLNNNTELEKLQETLSEVEEFVPFKMEAGTHIKGKHYLPKFKHLAMKYAETHTFQQTASQFRVHPATISGWCKEQKTKELMNKDRKPHDEGPNTAEQMFIRWLCECREKNVKVNAQSVRKKCHELIETVGVEHVEKHCRWFAVWYNRWDEPQQTENNGAKEKHLNYPPALKLEIAEFAERHNQSVATKTFNISRKRIADWMNSKGTLAQLAESGLLRNKGAGRVPVSLAAEKDLWKWYSACRSKGFKPKTTEIRAKAKELYEARGFSGHKCSNTWMKRWCCKYGVQLRYEKDDDIIEWVLTQFDLNRTVTHRDLQDYGLALMSHEVPDFKASAGWSIRFCKRHPQLLQSLAPVNEHLTSKMESSISKLRKETQDLQQKCGISLACIGNMDEIPLSFSAITTSIRKDGSKPSTLLRRPGMENCQAAIIVSCLADGGVLPPFVVIKGRPTNNVSSAGQLTVYKDKLEVDKDTILLWLSQVWLRYVPSPNLLVMDCFEPHLDLSVTTQMEQHGVNVAVIPGGCTSKVQPIDIGIKKFFESSIEESWNKCVQIPAESNKSNKQCLPSSDEIISWVSKAYEKLLQKQEIVRRSFVVAGLVESLDNSHEDLVENPSWNSGCDSSAEVSADIDSE